MLYRSIVVKKELSQKAKLSVYQSIYVPTLTYGHELWVVTKRTRSRIQVAEMSFLWRVAGLSLSDRVRSSDIRREHGVEAAAPLRRKASAEVVRASDQEASRVPPFRGFPGTSDWEERPEADPEPAGGIICLIWPGNASGSPGGARECCWGEGGLESLA